MPFDIQKIKHSFSLGYQPDILICRHTQGILYISYLNPFLANNASMQPQLGPSNASRQTFQGFGHIFKECIVLVIFEF